MEEIEFLDHQYVIIRDKIYKKTEEEDDEANLVTDLLIFKVSDGSLLYDSTKD